MIQWQYFLLRDQFATFFEKRKNILRQAKGTDGHTLTGMRRRIHSAIRQTIGHLRLFQNVKKLSAIGCSLSWPVLWCCLRHAGVVLFTQYMILEMGNRQDSNLRTLRNCSFFVMTNYRRSSFKKPSFLRNFLKILYTCKFFKFLRGEILSHDEIHSNRSLILYLFKLSNRATKLNLRFLSCIPEKI